MYDVLIVGAGPAGLNAAMVLGRQRRDVLVVDSGTPRNAPAKEMHMFLGRDGTNPADLRADGRAELAAYPSVRIQEGFVHTATGAADDFRASLADGSEVHAKRILLTSGLTDHFPDIPGLRERFGGTVRHCPFCHGWESRDQPLAVLGGSTTAAMQARYIADRFSTDVVLTTNGPVDADTNVLSSLAIHGIQVDERPIARLDGDGDLRIVYTDGDVLKRAAMFAFPATTPQSAIGDQLGARLTPGGSVIVDPYGRSTVPGLSAAGDAAQAEVLPGPPSSVIASAGAGASTAMWLEQELFRSSLDITLPA
ncbi:MAG: NAD(P)/FAD-dependent oxidoreductase [Cumulibacter sp.]